MSTTNLAATETTIFEVLTATAIAAIEEYAGTAIPSEVQSAAAHGNASALAAWIDSLETQPSAQALATLKETSEEAGLDPDLMTALEEQSQASQLATTIAELETYAGSAMPDHVKMAVSEGNASAIADWIESLEKQPSSDALDTLKDASESTGISTDLIKALEGQSESAQLAGVIAALEMYAGGVPMPEDVKAAVAQGNASVVAGWIDSLEMQPSSEALLTLKESSDVTGIDAELVMALVEQSKTSQLETALEEFSGLDNISAEVVERIMSGDSDALKSLIESMADEPTLGDFEDLLAKTEAILLAKVLEKVQVIQSQLLPLDTVTMAAIEEYAGRRLPASISRALASGNESAARSWLDSLDPVPDDNAAIKLKSSGVTLDIQNIINSWHEDQLQPTEVAKLESLAGIKVPEVILAQIANGSSSSLTKWMADNAIMPTESEWASTGLTYLPVNIQEDLTTYRSRQLQLETLAKLHSQGLSDVPLKVKQDILSSGNNSALFDWIVKTGQDPAPAVWESLAADINLPAWTKADLDDLRTLIDAANCRGPWAEWGEWSECPVTCGRGDMVRKRRRVTDGCPIGNETLFCNQPFCGIDCVWSHWAAWGSCSESCGHGVSTRYRQHAVKASGNGHACEGLNREAMNCTGDTCVYPTISIEMTSTLEKAGIDAETAAEPAAFSAAAMDTIPFYLAQLSMEEKMKLGHQLRDTVPLCSYNGVKCPYDDFSTYYDESLGNCFTFNQKIPAKYIVERPGAPSGLQILLQSDQSEYICSSQIGGFKLMIHNQTVRPFADTLGFNVAPGKTTAVALSQLQIQKQAPPYGDCTQLKKSGFLYNGTHTIEGCLRSCYQKHLTRVCKCADPRFAIPANATACGVEKKLCLDYYSNCVNDDEDNSMSCEQCTNPCESYEYLMTTSSGDMLDTGLLSNVCGMSQSEAVKSTCASGSSKSRNFAMVQIYYDRMNMMLFSEVKDYEMTNLISDFAGVLGITMGASVLTMFEFIYAVIAFALHAVSTQKVSILA